MPMPTSAELVWLLAAVAKGDPAAFERFYEATCGKLFGVVLRITQRPVPAAEVMEAAYLEAWQTAGRFDPGVATPMGWLVGIARRLAIDAVRLRPDAAGVGDAETSAEVSPESAAAPARREVSEELKRLLGCIGRLDSRSQRLLLAAYFGALSREQLASQLDVPANSIRPTLHRCLADLRACLAS